jgi:2Fe-2S ferredoxin
VRGHGGPRLRRCLRLLHLSRLGAEGLESLSEQEDAEADRLDQAFDVRAYSRLSCQSLVGSEDVDVDITQESLQAFLDENPDLRHRLEAEGKWPLKR